MNPRGAGEGTLSVINSATKSAWWRFLTLAHMVFPDQTGSGCGDGSFVSSRASRMTPNCSLEPAALARRGSSPRYADEQDRW